MTARILSIARPLPVRGLLCVLTQWRDRSRTFHRSSIRDRRSR